MILAAGRFQQLEFGGSREAFDGGLADEGCAASGLRFMVDKVYGSAVPGVLRCGAVVVLPKSAFQTIGDARIERSIATADDINPPELCWLGRAGFWHHGFPLVGNWPGNFGIIRA